MSKKKRLTDVFKEIDIAGPDDCWNFTGKYNEQRRMPEFFCNGRKIAPYVVVWELVNGPLEKGQIILHSCDNRICCNVKHMRPGTRRENNEEAEDRERHGANHHVVRGIRKLLDEGRTQQSIAELYGVSREMVSAIATGRNHKRTVSGELERDAGGQPDVLAEGEVLPTEGEVDGKGQS